MNNKFFNEEEVLELVELYGLEVCENSSEHLIEDEDGIRIFAQSDIDDMLDLKQTLEMGWMSTKEYTKFSIPGASTKSKMKFNLSGEMNIYQPCEGEVA